MKKQQNLDHGAWDAMTAGAVQIVNRDHLKSRIERGDRLRVKLGLDPTKPDIHLGHTVQLRTLRRYQQHGHQAVLIIGDWTARIGDPSGQNVTRPQLTKEEVTAAATTYLDQAWKILDEGETEVRLQSEWFDKMHLENVVQLTSRYTVARMLAREDFAKRTKDGRPVGMHELLYPLLQAYDSVAVKSDLELGGVEAAGEERRRRHRDGEVAGDGAAEVGPRDSLAGQPLRHGEADRGGVRRATPRPRDRHRVGAGRCARANREREGRRAAGGDLPQGDERARPAHRALPPAGHRHST